MKKIRSIFFLLISHNVYAMHCAPLLQGGDISTQRDNISTQRDDVTIQRGDNANTPWEKFIAHTPKPVTLIFFSTWCSDCKLELEKLNHSQSTKNILLIGEFDTQERLERNLNSLHIDRPCFFDKEGFLRKKFGVKLVPEEREIP